MKKILLPLAIGVLLAMPQAAALAQTKTSKTFSAWQVECVETEKKEKGCVMSQFLVNQKTKKRVMTMMVRKPKDEPYKVVLQVPLGGDISEGVSLALDSSGPVKIAYKTCLPRGCLAEFELTDDWAKAFSGGTNCTVGVKGLKGESVPFKLTLKGFTDALAFFKTQAP